MRIVSIRAYTLVEIMIVVAVLAILASVAFRSYISSGKTVARQVCINNLKQIDGAVGQWAFEYHIEAGTVPSAEQEGEIYSYLMGGKPRCPSSGVYTFYGVGDKSQVRCSREEDLGHKLPE